MPNLKRIKKLRDDFDRPWDPKAFRYNQSLTYISALDPCLDDEVTLEDAHSGCGTVCCIAGDVVLLFAPKSLRSRYIGSISSNAAKLARDLLGLTQDEADYMFYAFPQWKASGYEPTQADVVRYLDKVLVEQSVFVTID